MDTGSFIVQVKPLDCYKDITEEFETIFEMSNYELDTPIPKDKSEKVIGLMKK